ncbi:MAG TPA: radical SAM protein [Gemmataceae bacterium]|nr:radical SAM protein [Gemmataceae bacterium]
MKRESATLWPNTISDREPKPAVHHISPPDFLLQRSREAGRAEVWTLNLGKGRAADYLFCPERDYPSLANTSEIQLFDAVSARLTAELSWRQPLPQVIQIGTTLDPFHDSAEVQKEVGEIIKRLAERKIISWLVTRGEISGPILDQWAEIREWIRISLAVSSHDRAIQKVLEPAAATFEHRLETFSGLTQRGFRAEILLEPLLPHVTDAHEHLEELLEQLAEAGVRRLTAGYLVLHPERNEAIAKALEPAGWSELVLSAYADGVRIRKGPLAPAVLLSKPRRQRGYALLMALAANVGITVRLSARSNPDFGAGRSKAIRA